MCITFFYVNNNPAEGTFRLILVMNRDESIDRETEQAKWQDGVLAGRDMKKGKEGGTWLGMDKAGRVGLLANIFTGLESTGEGRGFLAVNFLKGEEDATNYMNKLVNTKVTYSPFNLCLFERNVASNFYVAHYYCSGSETIEREPPMCLRWGVLNGFSNHPFSKPFNKVERGKELLRKVIQECNDVEEKDQLIQRLFKAMCDEQKAYPDKQMESQMDPKSKIPLSMLEPLTSIFVDAAEGMTRMQTVILVDYNNVATFVERTRVAGGKNEQGEWQWMPDNRFDFKLV